MSHRNLSQPSLADALVNDASRGNAFLEDVAKLIDWSAFAVLFKDIHGNALGAPGYPPIAMFKISLLQQWYGLLVNLSFPFARVGLEAGPLLMPAWCKPGSRSCFADNRSSQIAADHACVRTPEIRPPRGSYGIVTFLQRPDDAQVPIHAPCMDTPSGASGISGCVARVGCSHVSGL